MPGAAALSTRRAQLAEALRQLDAGDHLAATARLEALRDAVSAEQAALDPDDERLRADALLALARAYPRSGQSQEAARAGCEALFWFEQLDARDGACDAHAQLALAYAQLGVGREALDHALQALDLARQLQDRGREAWALLRVGNAQAALDNPVQAREVTQQARELAQQLGLEELDFACLANQAFFTLDELEQARFDEDAGRGLISQAMAAVMAQQALELARQHANPYREAMALSNLNDALLLGGDWQRAQPLVSRLAELADANGFHTLQRHARIQQARLIAAQGAWQTAISQADSLLREAAGQLLPRQRKALLILLYESHKALGDAARALAYLEELMRVERQGVRDAQLVHTQLLMVREEVQQAVGRAERAQAEAQAAQLRSALLEREAKQLQQRLQDTDREAREDALTGLANRRHAEQSLATCLQMARRLQQPLSLGLLDLDHFKKVNDRFGHACGDAVLRELAGLLRRHLPASALAARWGGEEFLIVLPNLDAEAAQQALDALRAAVEQHDWDRLATGLAVTASIGATLAQAEDEDWARCLARADTALYAAKNAGRNRVLIG